MILLPCKEHHLRSLIENLRPEDREELAVSYGRDANLSDIMLRGWQGADGCEVILTDAGAVAGVWGYCAFLKEAPEHTGMIWLLATPLLQTVALPFLRACGPSIDKAHERYPTLVALPWRGNPLHIQWLEWCGFTTASSADSPFPLYSHVRTFSDSSRDGSGNGGGISRAVHAAEQGNLSPSC